MTPPSLTSVSPPLTDDERTGRERAVSDARVSMDLSGFAMSPEWEADSQAFIRGEITIEESIARTKARYAKDST